MLIQQRSVMPPLKGARRAAPRKVDVMICYQGCHRAALKIL
ncbi:MAG: hypothetical protein AB8G22_27230 [Saprospiraceae bacterium]